MHRKLSTSRDVRKSSNYQTGFGKNSVFTPLIGLRVVRSLDIKVTYVEEEKTYIHTSLTTPRWGFSGPMKQTTETNLTDTWQEADQLAF